MITNYGRHGIVAALVLISIWYYLGQWPPDRLLIPNPTQFPSEWDFKPHGIQNVSATAEFATVVFQASPSNNSFGLIRDLNIPLPPFTFADNNDALTTSVITTNVQLNTIPPRADASAIIFGVATTLDRLLDSIDGFAHWAAGTGTTIIALIPTVSSPDGQRTSIMDPAAAIGKASQLGFRLQIYTSDEDYIPRYVRLLGLMYEKSTPHTRWASIIDDDTFFPSTTRLLTMLSRYDASMPQYIGALSEDLFAMQKWGIFAFGGAGVFLSRPLLATLQPHLQTCVNFEIFSGDGKLSECIYKFSTAKMSVEPRLHQLDVSGDLSGFFEAVRPLPISLHHWKSWAHYDMVLTGAIAQITGDESVLAKFRFRDGWWMTHGFSIVKYSNAEDGNNDDVLAGKGKDPLAISHADGGMERTWEVLPGEHAKTYMHSLEPLRPRDSGKVQYLIERAVREDERTMSLYYVRRKEGDPWHAQGNSESEAESVIRVVWNSVL